MNGFPNGVGQVPAYGGRLVSPAIGAAGICGLENRLACVCNGEKISVVHAYLKEHFPDRVVRDLHAPTKLMRAGVLAACGDYHVVSLPAERPSHVVLLKDFLERSLAEIEEHLWQWDLACVLRTQRIVIVGGDRVSSL